MQIYCIDHNHSCSVLIVYTLQEVVTPVIGRDVAEPLLPCSGAQSTARARCAVTAVVM